MLNFFRKAKKSTVSMALMVFAVLASATSAFAASPAPLTFDTVDIGLPVGDVLTSAVNFMNIFGDYTMLGVAVIMAAVIIGFIFWVIGKIRRAAPGK